MTTKRRWIALPPRAQIDTSNPDEWRFPVGTKLWKEFVRDGIRIETRMMEKIGVSNDAWLAVAYIWDRKGRDVYAAPKGAENVNGTAHDVPAAATCMACHGGRASRVLGFSAIQLAGRTSTGLTLKELARRNALTDPMPQSLRIPGDNLTQRALGALHVNCSHCHNARRPKDAPSCFDPRADFDLSLWTTELAQVADTAVYRTVPWDVYSRGERARIAWP